jgi:hypothetical protein
VFIHAGSIRGGGLSSLAAPAGDVAWAADVAVNVAYAAPLGHCDWRLAADLLEVLVHGARDPGVG